MREEENTTEIDGRRGRMDRRRKKGVRELIIPNGNRPFLRRGVCWREVYMVVHVYTCV